MFIFDRTIPLKETMIRTIKHLFQYFGESRVRKEIKASPHARWSHRASSCPHLTLKHPPPSRVVFPWALIVLEITSLFSAVISDEVDVSNREIRVLETGRHKEEGRMQTTMPANNGMQFPL